MNRKGIILAGGSGTRLYPLTKSVSKQILPIYDKPMIYYPISTLMHAGIREIAIISTPRDIPSFKDLLGDGSNWGLKFSYIVQPAPDGLAQAFILAEEFLNGSPSALILGDNIFYGHEMETILMKASMDVESASLFAYHVNDPKAYGVVEFNQNFNVLSIEEKPNKPKSNFAVTGLYFYDKNVCNFAKTLKPSGRGELEITDLNNIYLNNNNLKVNILGRGFAWLDTGTQKNMLEASFFVSTIENRQGLKISCPEEIAFRKGFISKEEFKNITKTLIKSDYGKYLQNIIKDN
jgi:glucose-1-phosphate thymidylyltransferase